VAARSISLLAFGTLLLAAHVSPAAVDLTDTERRWLSGATPPVEWALKQGMPIDIVVLPQAQPGAAPIAMGYDADGRCKLVFAMRGNPAAESTLAQIPTPLLQATLEAMTAHEIGHCQRHRSGAFNSLPVGLTDQPDSIEARQPTPELQAMAREMRVTRREEAFADLVGLAWTHAHHADQFTQVLAWFDAARSDETPHGFHDTRHWLALAHARDAFTGDAAATANPFDEAAAMWQRGLLDD
jgi:hypothetical protein